MEQPDNPPGETPGVGAVGEIPGVNVLNHEGEEGPNHDSVDDEPVLGVPGVGNDENKGAANEQGTVGGYSLRNRRGRNYNHRSAEEDFVVGDDAGVILVTTGSDEVLETAQMSLKAGLRTFGDDGMKAVERVVRQLHDRDVMKPVH